MSKSAELLLLIPVDLLGLINELCQVVGDLGLLFDLCLKLGDYLSGLAVPLLVLFELYVGLQHLLVKFELLLEQVIVLLLLLVELDSKFMVVLLGSLLLRDELLNFNVLVALQLGLQTLDGHVLAGEGLFLELLILDLGEALGLGKLILLLAQVLSDVLELLHLDLLHLQVDTRIEDLIAQLGLLSQTRLVVGKALDLCLDCVAVLREFLNALLFVFDKSTSKLHLKLVTGCGQVVKGLVLNEVHLIVVLLSAFATVLALVSTEIVLSDGSLVVQVFHLTVELELAFAVDCLVLELLFFHFVILRDHDVDLRVKHKLFSNDLKLELVKLLNLLVVVSAHFLILLLQERYVLEAGLFIVEEAADAGLLLILDDFLFQYLELKLHEVNLLLQV